MSDSANNYVQAWTDIVKLTDISTEHVFQEFIENKKFIDDIAKELGDGDLPNYLRNKLILNYNLFKGSSIEELKPIIAELKTRKLSTYIFDDKETKDIVFDINATILPYISSIVRTLESIDATTEDINKTVGWVQNSATKLATLVSKNTIASNIYCDKELIFSRSIDTCISIIIRSLYSHISTQSPIKSIELIDIESFPFFDDAVRSRDMGYANHKEFTFDYLFNKALEDLKALINDKTRSIPKDLYKPLISAYIDHIDNCCAYAWNKSADDLMDWFGSLDKEEASEYLKNDGRNPMSYERFHSNLMKEIKKSDSTPFLIFDYDGAYNESEKLIKLVWGMSDSLFEVTHD